MKPLPIGQRERSDFPRFGLTHFAQRFPKETSRIEIQVVGEVENEVTLTDLLADLPRHEQVSDFHCVTTWSHRSIRWSGVRFADFYQQLVEPQARPRSGATLVGLRGQDGAYTGMFLEDLLADDVLLADRMNGEPLTVDHGAPIRLVAPAHYGYKSVKYLCRLHFMDKDAGYRVSLFRFMDHPRARVALEERGRFWPGWFLRRLYRPLIGPTVRKFAAEAAKREKGLD